MGDRAEDALAAASARAPGTAAYEEEGYYAALRAAAELGHPDAELTLAVSRLMGNATAAVQWDVEAALDSIRGLADTGHPGAQHWLGFALGAGLGMDGDQAKGLV